MPSFCCIEELLYASQLRRVWFLIPIFTTKSLQRVVWILCRYCVCFGRDYLLRKVDYWLKETVFERCLRFKSTDPLFPNKHCDDVFDVPLAWHCQLFVKLPEWLEGYRFYCLLYALYPVVFAYYSNFPLSGDHNNLLFRLAVAKHFGPLYDVVRSFRLI